MNTQSRVRFLKVDGIIKTNRNDVQCEQKTGQWTPPPGLFYYASCQITMVKP